MGYALHVSEIAPMVPTVPPSVQDHGETQPNSQFSRSTCPTNFVFRFAIPGTRPDNDISNDDWTISLTISLSSPTGRKSYAFEVGVEATEVTKGVGATRRTANPDSSPTMPSWVESPEDT